MNDSTVTDLLTKTEFTVECGDGRYTARAALPDDAPLGELAYESTNLETVLPELYNGVQLLAKHGTVNANRKERGEHVAAIAPTAPGVVDAEYTPQIHRVTITHTTLQTDTYSDLQWFGGLSKTGWWLSQDREHGPVLIVEYDVDPFAPSIPTEYSWEAIKQNLDDRDPDVYLSQSSSFDQYLALTREATEVATDEPTLSTHPDIMEGRPRLTGTTCSAFHAYVLIVLRGGSPEQVRERVYPDLSIEEIEFMVNEVAEHYKEEAEQYARTSITLFTEEEEVPVDELPPWPRTE